MGYGLHIQITNVGNLICENVSVVVKLPLECIFYVSPQVQEESRNGIAHLNFDLKSLARSSPTSRRQGISLLPGKSKQTTCALAEGAVEAQTDWKIVYSIHPDQGYATEGEIPFDQIEIRSRKPTAPPSPDSIE